MNSDPIATIAAALHEQPAPIMAQAGDPVRDGDDGPEYDRPSFPLDGPVVPLGINSTAEGSQKCYYLNYNKQVVPLEAGNRHGKNGLIALYGPKSAWLELYWPQWSAPKTKVNRSTGEEEIVKKSELVGFDQAEASRAHIEACCSAGVFDPVNKLRGRGAHSSSDGRVIVHLGDAVIVPKSRIGGGSEWQYISPGVYDGFVYSGGEAMMRPWHQPVGVSVAHAVLDQLETWHWRRGALDAQLALGGICQSYLGGFHDWRAVFWVTGPRGSGKSTFNGKVTRSEGFLGHLLGKGVFSSSGASAAAIRQTLANSTVPVLIDELEPDAGSDKVKSTIELARVAAGGGEMHRGSTDHNARAFTLQSVFWFSSILVPPLQPQDRSRIITLELRPLKKVGALPDFTKMRADEMGQKLFRRMIDTSGTVRHVIDAFRDALAASGHDARACAVFGTTLACAHVALHDGMPDDELIAHWVGLCHPSKLREIADAQTGQAQCIGHITSSMVQARGGDERASLGTWFAEALHEQLSGIIAGSVADDKYSRRLQEIGFKIVNAVYHPAQPPTRDKPKGAPPRWGADAKIDREQPIFLAVANGGQALAALFKDTNWHGGVWTQELARQYGAISGVKVKFRAGGQWRSPRADQCHP